MVPLYGAGSAQENSRAAGVVARQTKDRCVSSATAVRRAANAATFFGVDDDGSGQRMSAGIALPMD